MDSFERFNKASFGWNRKMLKMTGFDVYDKDFSPNLHAFVMCILGIAFASILIYSFVISDNIIRLDLIFFISLTSQVSVFTAHKSQFKSFVLILSLIHI